MPNRREVNKRAKRLYDRLALAYEENSVEVQAALNTLERSRERIRSLSECAEECRKARRTLSHILFPDAEEPRGDPNASMRQLEGVGDSLACLCRRMEEPPIAKCHTRGVEPDFKIIATVPSVGDRELIDGMGTRTGRARDKDGKPPYQKPLSDSRSKSSADRICEDSLPGVMADDDSSHQSSPMLGHGAKSFDGDEQSTLSGTSSEEYQDEKQHVNLNPDFHYDFLFDDKRHRRGVIIPMPGSVLHALASLSGGT